MTMAIANESQVLTLEQLDQIAVAIKREHSAAEQSVRTGLRHACAAGQKLLEAKAQLKHGEFMPWVEKNCGFKHPTANLYMRVAREWGARANSEQVANLTLREAARLLRNREDDINPDAPVDWRVGLPATDAYNASRRLLSDVYAFADRLEGGALYGAMRTILSDRVSVDQLDLEKIRLAFAECRNRVDRCVQGIDRRLEGGEVTWRRDEPGLLELIGQKRERPKLAAPEDSQASTQ